MLNGIHDKGMYTYVVAGEDDGDVYRQMRGFADSIGISPLAGGNMVVIGKDAMQQLPDEYRLINQNIIVENNLNELLSAGQGLYYLSIRE